MNPGTPCWSWVRFSLSSKAKQTKPSQGKGKAKPSRGKAKRSTEQQSTALHANTKPKQSK
jgi:hypothetical protein